MTEYLTPGTYIERVDASTRSITAIRTDITGFVGMAESGPLDTPVPLESFRQFQSHFGEFLGGAYMAYAVRAFFENGGRRCYCVRVASKDQAGGARESSVVLSDEGAAPRPVWEIAASSPGVWGNDLSVQIDSNFLFETISDPANSTVRYATVGSVAGFVRSAFVRLSQPGKDEAWRVVPM